MTHTAFSPPSVAPTSVHLTRFAAGGGCACKIPIERLEAVVEGLEPVTSDAVLVGLDHGDDAAAVRIEHQAGKPIAIVSTADFFTPMVDDPFDWGRIAAANALSDVYAMGASPVVALNLVVWPDSTEHPDLSDSVLAEVLRGGQHVAREAGCPLIGGHSITGPEPVYGLAVTGHGHPDRLLRNDAAKPGEVLSLTKPLGVGILNNHFKRAGQLSEAAVQSMTELNAQASRESVEAGVRAATDVTGFGLLGHLIKMCRASGVGAEIEADAVPLLEGALEALQQGFFPGGSQRNLEWAEPHVRVEFRGSTRWSAQDAIRMLADAQTSGGLIVAGEIPSGTVIGRFVAADEPTITLR